MTSEVKIEVTSRHDATSDRVKGYAVEKAGKLARFHDRLSRIQVVFDSGVAKRRSIEMIVHVDTGHTFVATQQGDHAKETIDLLVEKMAKQLKKDKERAKDHHKPDGKKGGVPRTKAPASEETFDDVVDAQLRARRRKAE